MQAEQRNFILAIVLSALVLFGWSAISNRYFPTATPQTTKIADGKTTAVPAPAELPAPSAGPAVQRSRAAVLAAAPRVAIRTPHLVGSLSLRGARIDDLVLPTYRETIDPKSPPVRLLSPEGGPQAYFAGFGWLGTGVALPGPDSMWRADRTVLTPGAPVMLRYDNGAGLTFIQKIAVDDQFMFTVEQRVANTGASPVSVRPYAFVNRADRSLDQDLWTAHVGPIGAFNGAMDYAVTFDNLDGKEPGFWTRLTGTKAVAGTNAAVSNGGWLGFGDKYWLAAVAPQGTARIDAAFRGGAGSYQSDFARAPITIAPGRAASVTTYFFAGAKEVDALNHYERSLGIPLFGKAIDWGWFEVFEKPIFQYLHWLSNLIGNFGVAIMVLTLTVRGLMFPIAQRQFKSMAAMRVVQPKMKAIQERFKDDKVRQQQEVMALYKAEKINPLAGCLPVVLQIPIFYALYKVLVLTIEMRHQPFALWIHDLSAPDPLTPVNLFGLLNFSPSGFLAIGVLPIILGITMWMQFKLNPAPTDPIQAQMFSIMPWIMMFVMAPFAAGLQLYYIVSNLLTIGQQKWLYSRYPGMREATTTPVAT